MTEITELSYEEITPALINSIKGEDKLKALIFHWKKLADGKDADMKIVRVRLAIYEHFLYINIRDEIRICDMEHKYIKIKADE